MALVRQGMARAGRGAGRHRDDAPTGYNPGFHPTP